MKVRGATKELDQATIDRARQLAGLKGYVTNLQVETMTGEVDPEIPEHVQTILAAVRVTNELGDVRSKQTRRYSVRLSSARPPRPHGVFLLH